MKKLLLLTIVLFSAINTFAQTIPLTVSFRGNTPVNSKDTIAYTYPGKIGGYSWLYNAEYIRTNFAPITGGAYVPNSRLVSTGYGLSGGGNLGSNLTLIVDTATLKGNFIRNSASFQAGSTFNTAGGTITNALFRLYDTSLGEMLINYNGIIVRNLSGIPTTLQLMPASGNLRINQQKADSSGVYWDSGYNEFRIGYKPWINSPAMGGDCSLCIVKSGAHNKIRQSTFGGSWNYIAWNRANGTITSPTALQNGDIGGSLVTVGYGTTNFYHGAEYRQIATGIWSDTQNPMGHHWRTSVTGSLGQIDAMGLGMSSTGVDLELYAGKFIGLGANITGNILASGSLGATGSRLVKGWFTDLQVTNAIAGSVTGNAATATALQNARTIGVLTGDITSPGSTFDGTATNTNVATLATVNSSVGSFGSSTQSPVIAVNGKGLIISASNATITPAVGSITGLGTGIATALSNNIGSADAPVLFNGAGGTPSSMTGTNITGTASALNIGGNAATVTTIPTLSGDVSNTGNSVTVNKISGSTTVLPSSFVTSSLTTLGTLVSGTKVGSGTGSPTFVINGGTGSGAGPYLTLKRNSVDKAYFGGDGVLFSNNTDDITIATVADFNIRAGSGFPKRLNISASTGLLQMPAYGAGVLQTDASGNVTSSAALLSGTTAVTPSGSTDVANKAYVDAAIGGDTKSLFANTSSLQLTNTATETSLVPTGTGSMTVPTALPGYGQYRLTIGGVYSTPAITAGTLTIKIKYNGTIIATGIASGFLAGASNLAFDGVVKIVSSSTGVSGTMLISGGVSYSVANNAARFTLDLNNSGSATTVNNSAGGLIEVTGQWDTANASKTITITQFTLEQIK